MEVKKKKEDKSSKDHSSLYADFRKVLEEVSKTSIEKVVPVKESAQKGMKQISIFLPEDHVKELRFYQPD